MKFHSTHPSIVLPMNSDGGLFLQMVVGPLLAGLHIYSVTEEMRAAPVNTLNPQRTAMIVAEFVKVFLQKPQFQCSICSNFPVPVLLVFLFDEES